MKRKHKIKWVGGFLPFSHIDDFTKEPKWVREAYKWCLLMWGFWECRDACIKAEKRGKQQSS